MYIWSGLAAAKGDIGKCAYLSLRIYILVYMKITTGDFLLEYKYEYDYLVSY